jgi:hypothetical protein
MLKIRDNPKEWRKFAALLAGVALAGIIYYAIRGRLAANSAVFSGVATLVLFGFLMSFPRVVRPLYLGWMTIGHYLGQFTGRILLTVLFLLVVIPLGLVLRIMGNDLLHTRRQDLPSYWETPHRQENLERLF